MSVKQLIASHQEKVWGFEEWQFSTHPNGMTKVAATGTDLRTELGQSLPILIKYIVANETLSVQVHPDDQYAKTHTTDLGKTECWYITEAQPEAKLIFGLKPGLTAETLATIIAEQQIEAYLEFVDVQAGDMLYIPAGTVHAIMGGLKLIEVQQSSDTTYRLYDWGRDREIHVEESLAVIDYQHKNGACKIAAQNFTELVTPYFTVQKIQVIQTWEYTCVQAATVTALNHQITVFTETHPTLIAPNTTLYVELGTTLVINEPGELLLTTWEVE